MRIRLSVALAMTLAVAATVTAGTGGAGARPKGLPPIKHVFTIVLENKDYEETFGDASEASWLANRLTAKGQLLTNYHGTGHASLGNYITMISGQSENPQTQADCGLFNELAPGAVGADGQAIGTGCVYPATVRTVADQLEAAGFAWRAYMEDMGDDLRRDRTATCSHPAIGTRDVTQRATAADQYATRHNPFVYFHSIIDDDVSCTEHVVNLDRLRRDLKRPQRTRNYTFISPDLCSDGHDRTCADPAQPGGYAGIDAFLRRWVPRILKSRAYRRNGLLIVTFDEAESSAGACCYAPAGPNALQQGIYGPGGGRTGTVLLSPFIERGSVNATPYNHYDYLRTVETIFGLDYLGYAGRPEVRGFGADVFGR